MAPERFGALAGKLCPGRPVLDLVDHLQGAVGIADFGNGLAVWLVIASDKRQKGE